MFLIRRSQTQLGICFCVNFLAARETRRSLAVSRRENRAALVGTESTLTGVLHRRLRHGFVVQRIASRDGENVSPFFSRRQIGIQESAAALRARLVGSGEKRQAAGIGSAAGM